MTTLIPRVAIVAAVLAIAILILTASAAASSHAATAAPQLTALWNASLDQKSTRNQFASVVPSSDSSHVYVMEVPSSTTSLQTNEGTVSKLDTDTGVAAWTVSVSEFACGTEKGLGPAKLFVTAVSVDPSSPAMDNVVVLVHCIKMVGAFASKDGAVLWKKAYNPDALFAPAAGAVAGDTLYMQLPVNQPFSYKMMGVSVRTGKVLVGPSGVVPQAIAIYVVLDTAVIIQATNAPSSLTALHPKTLDVNATLWTRKICSPLIRQVHCDIAVSDTAVLVFDSLSSRGEIEIQAVSPKDGSALFSFAVPSLASSKEDKNDFVGMTSPLPKAQPWDVATDTVVVTTTHFVVGVDLAIQKPLWFSKDDGAAAAAAAGPSHVHRRRAQLLGRDKVVAMPHATGNVTLLSATTGHHLQTLWWECDNITAWPGWSWRCDFPEADIGQVVRAGGDSAAYLLASQRFRKWGNGTDVSWPVFWRITPGWDIDGNTQIQFRGHPPRVVLAEEKDTLIYFNETFLLAGRFW